MKVTEQENNTHTYNIYTSRKEKNKKKFNQTHPPSKFRLLN